MTDKELLELAAKAAGVEGEYLYDGYGDGCFIASHEKYQQGIRWNPLTDDGDALRLAVKLGIDFRFHRHEGAIVTNYPIGRGMSESIVVLRGNDPYEATRRAIVRAAAEIGKSL